jgi:membrane glycosyltransferase
VSAGLGFGALAFHISWAAFFWMLPIAAALTLAPVVSWATGLAGLGRWLWHWNVFRIPEEAAPAGEAVEALVPESSLEAAE